LNSDNVQLSLRYSDGSIGNITYAANGGSGLPKEKLEIFCGGISFVLNDFKSVEMHADNKMTTIYKGTQDKGHRAELQAFASSYLNNEDLSKSFESAVAATMATFAAVESLSCGDPVKID